MLKFLSKRREMKKIIEFFIRKPAFTHTLFIIVIISAVIAYKNVPKELFPPATLDKILIQGAYPGASPETLDKMAVIPIEDELKTYQEVAPIESVISNGNFVITANLKPGSNKLELLSEFKTITANVKKDLPSDMNEPTVTIAKKAFPLMFISVASNTLNKDELKKVADDIKKKFGKEASYPPGHGDFYQSFYRSGLLDSMIQRGKQILFVSNASFGAIDSTWQQYETG